MKNFREPKKESWSFFRLDKLWPNVIWSEQKLQVLSFFYSLQIFKVILHGRVNKWTTSRGMDLNVACEQLWSFCIFWLVLESEQKSFLSFFSKVVYSIFANVLMEIFGKLRKTSKLGGIDKSPLGLKLHKYSWHRFFPDFWRENSNTKSKVLGN